MKRPLHIGLLTPEYVTEERKDGGLANYLQKIASEFVHRNHRVTVFLLSGRNLEWKDGKIDIIEVPRAGPPKFPAFLRPKLERFLPLITALRSAKRIEKAVWRYHRIAPFDVLQTSSYASPGFALRKNGKIPVVCRISSYMPLCRSANGRQRGFAEYLTDWLEIRQVLDAEAAFAPSQFTAEIFERLENLRPAIIRSPIDSRNIELDDSVYQRDFSSFPYFAFVGTLSRLKGVDLLAEAIPQFLQHRPDVHFVFVGRDDGVPGFQKAFDCVLSQASDFQENIHHISALSKNKLYPVVRHSLALVAPSRVDNYPNACLEAHAMLVPVIGTTNSSLEEMILENETGFLIKNGDTSELTTVLLKVAGMSESERNRMKGKIEKYVQSIEAENRIDQLLNLYLEAMAKVSSSKL
ncbi:glycosyltransferase family 4 protein [bacterium]|nr:glycosyltransferase family 4 protein [bacterium]